MHRLYLAGPMSNLPNLNFPLFNKTAEDLRGQGYIVVNPAEINVDTSSAWDTCMKADIKELLTCDCIYMLPGWENSKGASLEKHIAEALGFSVILGG